MNRLCRTIGLLGLLSSFLHADNRIVMYLRHAPDQVIQEVIKEADRTQLTQKIISNIKTQTPGYNSQRLVKNAINSYARPPLSGIVASYGGFVTISDRDGQLSFPQRQAAPKLYLVITPNPNLVRVKGETFSHEEAVAAANNPVKVYSFQLQQDPDPKKQWWYWDVKEEPALIDNTIKPISIVLQTDPRNIIVATGKFLGSQNVQLVLPDNIFLVDRSSLDVDVLKGLDRRRYFEPVSVDQKKAGDNTVTRMISNI